MTLYQIIQILKQIALTQPNIKSATDGSIYEVMNTNPSVKYDVVHFSQTTHQSDEETDYYGLNIFYVSRLEDSLENNRLQIQSIGKEVLDNIIRTFCENWNIDFPVITYTPFTQKFNDLCAGCYCNLRLEIPKEIICADDYVGEVIPSDKGIRLQDISITIKENGVRVVTPAAGYDGIGQITINTDVPQELDPHLEDKEVEYTKNGSYGIVPGPGYDGIASVSIDIDVPSRYDEGYDDGAADQKAKLTVTSFTENNTYTRENGWSAVTISVPSDYQDGYDDGFDDGEAAQKAKMVATAITVNGEYERPDGYASITVNVPAGDDRYEEGFNDGMQYQKNKMVVTSVTENGLYMREDGYVAFNVEVPQTGSSNEDLIANLQGDYYLIPYGTTHLRDFAFYQTCFSSITIPTTVSAIGQNAFAYNGCLTSITIPDSVQIVGAYAFRNCTNLQTVILGSGLKALNVQTFVYCDSLTGITIPSGITSIGSNVFFNCTGLTEMTFEGLTPPTINTGTSLGSTAYTFPIYVPCQSLDAYKTAFGEHYAPRIQCKEEPQPTGDTAITAITLVVNSAITDSGTATTTYSPIDAPTDIYYTSSDPAIATVDSGTGVITVIADGTVTICVNDRISGLQDCKVVTVTKSEPSLNTPLTMHIIQAGNIVWKTNDASFATTIQYKKNNGEWTNITATTSGTVIPVVSGDTLWFRGNNSRYALGPKIEIGTATTSFNTFGASTAGFELSNNIMSLINSSNFATLNTLSSENTFVGLFDRCSGLTKAENLLMPATSLTKYCYSQMFIMCRYLTSAPYLPATSLAYGCYEQMFQYCVALKTAPSILPALTLQPYCYSWMFMNCSALTQSPELPAKTLVSYSYLHMFDFCLKLQKIKCLATNISAVNCTAGWVDSVAANGVFTKAAGMSSWTRGKDGIPTGWTVTNN